MQRAAILFTIFAPVVIWLAARRGRDPLSRFVLRRTLALAVLFLGGLDFATKTALGETSLSQVLPMQLCDWALWAAAAALWWRWPLGFELAYFWGLAGTAQALFTPALDAASPWWRQFAFFFVHAFIVAGVLHLLLTERMRPRPGSLPRVVACSQIYLLCALLTNALTGGNYGFLSRRPPQASALDLFSDWRWLYVLEIDLTALLLFALLYLPWLLRDGWKRREPKGAFDDLPECGN